MTAVIYARYSSDNQREESIEGQIRECTDYAEKNGVHLISVMEPIAEGSQGILVETLLEGMAEYYSAELSEKVIRGQTENALKGKCTGGTGTIGYKIDEEKFYHLDPLTSPLVLEAFQRYDNGDKMVKIVNFLNDKGVRNMQGGKMTHSSVNTMLKNRRYIGELSFRDIVVPDAIPAIVPKDLFDRVQKRLDKNKRAPACGKADEEYLLTTKLFCGKCGALMFGESGTSATGRTYYYYKCANVKRRKGCNKKTVQKEWLEELVVRETMKLIQDDLWYFIRVLRQTFLPFPADSQRSAFLPIHHGKKCGLSERWQKAGGHWVIFFCYPLAILRFQFFCALKLAFV
jgi:site-specific DNA recombinase